jgi:hypothetical protein
MARRTRISKNRPEAEPRRGEPKEAPPVPTVTKAEAVRRALGAGAESPADGVAYVLKHFGITMDRKTFSLNKSQQKARSTKQPDTRDRGDEPPPSDARRLAPHGASRENEDVLNALETLKPLIAEHGPDKLKRMVDLLG